ncbi:Acyl transferase/acyl hydrolase/lysophospholipase [Penicillium fimorum]|uniref:Acyl transferase/acyl hydrolase/lysophospholipase n=1 Tax=Penicillium fimorum TaxID=1882269 RepID=A0A9W9XPA0_9EURO|nr:Acyl transferase/acyl hydrolase/lysophospholipase [Penicillium fimorum]
MQQDAVRVWYEKFTQEGLNWGLKFAVMEEVFRDLQRDPPQINEDELIQIMNMALVNQKPSTWDFRHDHLADLLTGVEFIGPQEQQERGFEGENHVFANPRAALFTASFSRRAPGETQTHSTAAHIPKEIAHALRYNQDTTPVLDALRAVVSNKLSNHILLPESEAGCQVSDVYFPHIRGRLPFVVLLKRSMTVNLLTGLIAQGLQTSA